MDEFEVLTSRNRLRPGSSQRRLIVIGLVALLAVIIAFNGFFTVDQGYRGVHLRLGAVVGIAEPGLGFKVPFIDRVVMLRTQTNSKLYENMETYSRDQQLAEVRMSVTYRLAPDLVDSVYATFGSEEAMVSRLIDRDPRRT